MDNVSREVETSRKNKKCWRSKTLPEMKTTFNRGVSRLDMTEERISELEHKDNRNFQS